MKVLQSQTGAGHRLVDSFPSTSISLLCAAANKFVITGQGATISMTVVSCISVRQVREAKRRAVGAAVLFVVSAVASSASGMEDRARASVVYPVDVLVLLVVVVVATLRCCLVLGAPPRVLESWLLYVVLPRG